MADQKIVPVQEACGHARVFDHAGPPRRSRWRAWTYCLPLHRQRRRPGLVFYRGSMAGLSVPLPTLRRCPHGYLRTAWGRRGSLFLHRRGLTWAFSGQGVRFIGTSKTPVAVSVSKV